MERLIDLAEGIDVRVFPKGPPHEPAQPARRGRLKIFLSYAAGAGKTYRMLEEAQELKKRARISSSAILNRTAERTRSKKQKAWRSFRAAKSNIADAHSKRWIRKRFFAGAPKICAVDEFPHTNVPGSERAKRWEDVMVLLDAGIDVMTTMNLQHLESLNDQILQISGIRVRETVPDWVIKQADEVVMVDVTPEALINRLKRGVVYAPGQSVSKRWKIFSRNRR